MPPTALAKKLLLKPGQPAAVLNAPPDYVAFLGHEAVVETLAGSPDKSLDFVQLFVKTLEEAEGLVDRATRALKYDGLLWICYPKGGSKVSTDLNRDILWKAMEKHGLAGAAMVSIDPVWSAMRFRPSEKVSKGVH